ncbi:(S)-mandelate dehydrogenase [Phytophthora citrophthora]|uniref:(S)-mandelate dehydrogenase n=1 Tax=Phytophthora citrophthora TaxID=4793 RepID=A0AAD9H0M8_9STRA|nr:(S)-mandelate dehydrogenase [Phytophthora citrophthora]
MSNSSAIGKAFWTVDPEVVRCPPASLSSTQSSILCTKEARVQNEINVVFYETLLILHHLLVYLRTSAKMQRAARDRENYIAANNRQTHRKHESGNVPAEKQTDALADKLLEKHRFLMDSIVDVRLVRMAETSVAIVKFVLSHFATRTTASQLQVAQDSQLSHSSENFYDSRKKRLGALGSFLDEYQAVTESRAETRSLLFGTERTIEMPVSYGTSESTNAAMERLLNPGTTNRIGTAMSNGSMRLEYLDPSEPPSSIRDNDIFTDPSKLESSVKSCGEHIGTKNRKVSSDYPANYDGNNSQAYQFSLPASLKRSIGQTSPVHSVQSDVGANPFKSDDENDPVGPLLHSDQIPTAAKSPRAVRKAFQASDGTRRTANECDACIGCNDVCTNERCFFCAEKEYQLKVAFAGSSVVTGPTSRQAAWQHRAPSSVESSFNVEREYSSCEMKRHQSQRSCWIRVDDSVLDVTDLLGVHPGGAQVLLEAAKHGGDCGPILKTHPPPAQEMLMQYHLGQYFECNQSGV